MNQTSAFKSSDGFHINSLMANTLNSHLRVAVNDRKTLNQNGTNSGSPVLNCMSPLQKTQNNKIANQKQKEDLAKMQLKHIAELDF